MTSETDLDASNRSFADDAAAVSNPGLKALWLDEHLAREFHDFNSEDIVAQLRKIHTHAPPDRIFFP